MRIQDAITAPQKLMITLAGVAIALLIIYFSIIYHDKRVIEDHEAKETIKTDKEVTKDAEAIKERFASPNTSIDAVVVELLARDKNKANIQSVRGNSASASSISEENTNMGISSGLRDSGTNGQEDNRRRLCTEEQIITCESWCCKYGN